MERKFERNERRDVERRKEQKKEERKGGSKEGQSFCCVVSVEWMAMARNRYPMNPNSY